mmetsp:Transcript_30224/g.67723  ORF Transcript_30224/g.67723 Transcript_30224/m.67723 type:complete len:104 (-) Transcript_30224:560-871(-)
MKTILLLLCAQACGAFVVPSRPKLAHKKVTWAKRGEQEITDLNLEEMFEVFDAADKTVADDKGVSSAPMSNPPGSAYKGGGAAQAESEQRGALLLGFILFLNV